jgi:CHAT domain-containing protein
MVSAAMPDEQIDARTYLKVIDRAYREPNSPAARSPFPIYWPTKPEFVRPDVQFDEHRLKESQALEAGIARMCPLPFDFVIDAGSSSAHWSRKNMREEVIEVNEIVGKDGVLLLGTDATETAFKSASLVDFKIIHIAAHGFADTQFPERSGLVLGVDPTSHDDGLLQVREIIRLRFNADLVTLSACNTGIGKLQGEEGVTNLVEAFLVSGAKSVVASLWSADDTYTLALMERFYTHIAEGQDKASALRQAKLDLLAKYGREVPPYYWGAFVLVGDGGSPIPLRVQ